MPLPKTELVELLSPSLGEEKAGELVAATAASLGLNLDNLDENQALQILEKLAGTPGLVGITARFAKARALLKM